MKILTSLATALAAAMTWSNAVVAGPCESINADTFREFEIALLDAQAKGIAANLTAGPYATPVFGTQAFNESSMSGLVSRWNDLNGYYALTTTPTLPYLALMPTFIVQFGYELNWNIAHARYWADIHRWYSRASSPHANAILPAQQALDAVNLLHKKAEAINKLAAECLGSQAW